MARDTTKILFGQLVDRSQGVFEQLAEPQVRARIQVLLLVLLVIWGANSAARLLWSLWPTPSAGISSAPVINPVSTKIAGSTQVAVNLESMLELGLFGDPVSEALVEVEEAPVEDNPREGIEDGARETRLDLRLTGIVASSEDGLGTAVIEAKKEQVAYSVGDSLPAAGKVILAKVMAEQVVLSNNGTFELLTLFEGEGLSAALATKPTIEPTKSNQGSTSKKLKVKPAGDQTIEIRDRASTQLAANYRDQLYANPQSLGEVVKVSAVRGDNGLKGYRVAPGSDAAQFKQLGFKAGDVVTAVNGLVLSDPTNAMRLYQVMRDASSAVFDVERGGTSVTISVSLGE